VLTVGSLFAGIGGLELGLERTGGFKTVWQVENDEYATRVLERHWPGVRRWGDVRTFPPDTSGSRFSNGVECEGCQTKKRNVIDSYKTWHVDLICGGFPCQDISYAGKGAGLDGERSGLFYEAARIIRTLGPRYVLLENVAALLSRGLGDVLGTLASLGYDAEWHCIPAAAVGAPHIRDRVFIVAYRVGIGLEGFGKRRIHPIGPSIQATPNPGAIHKPASENGRKGWTTLAGFCRMAHGVSERLDQARGMSHDAEKRRSREILCRLRQAVDTEAIQGAVGGQVGVPSPKILQPSMRRKGPSKGECTEGNAAQASGPFSGGQVREVWGNRGPGPSPQGRQSKEQPQIESADLVWLVSHALALGTWKDNSQSLHAMRSVRDACLQIQMVPEALSAFLQVWQSLSDQEKDWGVMAACGGLWVSEWPNQSRVETAIPARMDRLRCLGNAVVPQVAEWIGYRILAVEGER